MLQMRENPNIKTIQLVSDRSNHNPIRITISQEKKPRAKKGEEELASRSWELEHPLHTYKRIRPGEIEPCTGADMTHNPWPDRRPSCCRRSSDPSWLIMDTEPDTVQSEIILGRPFLATAGAIIDARAGTLSLECGRVHRKTSQPV